MPPCGAVIGFITFIASTISRVSPALTVSPTAMNGFAPGSGDRIGGADHRRLDRVRRRRPRRGRRRCRRGGGRRGAQAPARRAAPATTAAARLARDLDLAVAVLDLDLGQLVVGQQLGELAHQRRDRCASIAACRAPLRGFGHCSHPLLNLALAPASRRSLAEVRRRVQCEHVAERRRSRRSSRARPARSCSAGGSPRARRRWTDAPRSPGSAARRPHRGARSRCGCSRRR